jgi:hypothetical protein
MARQQDSLLLRCLWGLEISAIISLLVLGLHDRASQPPRRTTQAVTIAQTDPEWRTMPPLDFRGRGLPGRREGGGSRFA